MRDRVGFPNRYGFAWQAGNAGFTTIFESIEEDGVMRRLAKF